MKILTFLGIAGLLLAGCHSPHLVHQSVVHAAIPFDYGTSAVLEFSTDLKEPGAYDLYLVFDANELKREENSRWPMMLPTRFHVLVWTNGETVIDQEVNKLGFSKSDQDRVAYSLTGFKIVGPCATKCQVLDLSDGSIRTHCSLRLKHSFPK